tara:strand:+ start:870 stop:2339 length:1470 start_codon:yes stop_codon:yes gene_type:complete
MVIRETKMSNLYPTKPIWQNPNEAIRCEHSALRYRMLKGIWEQDLLDALDRHVSSTRQEAWGDPDMSSNIFKETTKTLSALYMRPPIVTNPQAADSQTTGFLGTSGVLAESGLWARMKRVQFLTIGMRECFLRVDYSQGKLSHRIVSPDMVSALASSVDPETPICIKEMRLRKNPITKDYEWTIDLLDISNPEMPLYKVLRIEGNDALENLEDVSDIYLGGDLSGDAYPYRDRDDAPYLPYVLYHAELTGDLFDAYYNQELIRGSLNASVAYTFYFHVLRDCSYPQRYAFGAIPAGIVASNGESPQAATIETDPASILVFQSIREDGAIQPQFGQYEAGGDVESMLSAITTYERRLASLAGINPADAQKMAGDPRSGYAISISRSSLREAQAEYTPSFRIADLETISISAKMLNRFDGANYPETEYQIDYYELPQSPEELKAEREERNDLMDKSLMSSVQAIMRMFPDYDREDAITYLNQVKRDNALTL